MALVGRHVSVAGGLEKSFERAKEIGCNAMQIFVTNPRSWAIGKIDSGVAEAFRKNAHHTGITAIAHMPYLPNIGSSDPSARSKSKESLKGNAEACGILGIENLVTHMGSHMGKGKERGISNVIDAVESALKPGLKTRILLENEAGHKNSIGDEIRDLYEVRDSVKGKLLGFCLDTCHLFAAGYDITSHKALDRIFSEIDMNDVFAIHLNDAKMELGSRRDRHANIGKGHIGIEGFRSFLNYEGISEKIIVLETPASTEIGEAEEIALVRGLFS